MNARLRQAVLFLTLAAYTMAWPLQAAPARAGDWADKRVELAELVSRFGRALSAHGSGSAALSIAIGADGQVQYTSASGFARPGQPATPDTVYRIGSLTKQFTAAAILRLIEDGARSRATGRPLALDAPVADFFGGVEAWQVEGQAVITVRSLLNMTSNLPNFTRRPPDGLDPWGAVPASRLLAEVKRLRPSGWPNSFEYSNTSYFLLAELMETLVVGEPGRPVDYRNYLRGAMFRPAGLAATGFADDQGAARDAAIGNFKRKPVFADADWLKGSGDMFSSATDIFRWNKALFGGQVMSKMLRDEMLKEGGRITPTDFYGMGFFISPKTAWIRYSHTGAVPGFTSANAVSVRRSDQSWRSVTLLMNGEGVEGLDQLADDMLNVLERD